MYGISRPSLGLPLKISIMILIALMCAQITPGPDNFKSVIKYQTPFCSDFGSVANMVFSFETKGMETCQKIRSPQLKYS